MDYSLSSPLFESIISYLQIKINAFRHSEKPPFLFSLLSYLFSGKVAWEDSEKREKWKEKREKYKKKKPLMRLWKGDILTASFLSSLFSLLWKSRVGRFREKRKVKSEEGKVQKEKAAYATFLSGDPYEILPYPTSGRPSAIFRKSGMRTTSLDCFRI